MSFEADTSMYQSQNQQLPQMPDLAEVQMKRMGVQNMQRQQAAADTALQQQAAVKQAWAQSGGDRGKFMQSVSALGPDTMMQYQKGFGEADAASGAGTKAISEGDIAKMGIIGQAFDALDKTPEPQKPQAWSQITKDLASRGVIDSQHAQMPYDPRYVQQVRDQFHIGKAFLDNQQTVANTGHLNSETRKTDAETNKLTRESGGGLSTNNPDADPAVLVAQLVPKEHQAKAFAEVEVAENVQKMGGTIMEAFDNAAKENTVLKTGAGLLREPGSLLALHQALQPTFKDIENTVRQAAMDNTFHNVSPAPGDTDAKIAAKRKALADYLQSKLSAPTARGFGIDLAAYNRTRRPDSLSPGTGDGGGAGRSGDDPFVALTAKSNGITYDQAAHLLKTSKRAAR